MRREARGWRGPSAALLGVLGYLAVARADIVTVERNASCPALEGGAALTSVQVWNDLDEVDPEDAMFDLDVMLASDWAYDGDVLSTGGFDTETGVLRSWFSLLDATTDDAELDCGSMTIAADADAAALSALDSPLTDSCTWLPYFGTGYGALPTCIDETEPSELSIGMDLGIQWNNGKCCASCAPPAGTTVYARADLYATAAGVVTFVLTSSDAMAVMANGLVVATSDVCVPDGGDPVDAPVITTFTIDLAEGRNPILVKARNRNEYPEDMGFTLELGTPADKDAYGLYLNDARYAHPISVALEGPLEDTGFNRVAMDDLDDGHSVMLVIGAPNEGGFGAVYPYLYDGLAETWSALPLVVSSTVPRPNGAQFGHAVVLGANGTILAVGAPFEAFEEDPFTFAGGVYIFAFDGSDFTFSMKYRPTTAFPFSFIFSTLGASLDLDADANLLVVGAPADVYEGAIVGLTRVARRVDGAWDAEMTVVPPPSPAEFSFGTHVLAAPSGEFYAVAGASSSFHLFDGATHTLIATETIDSPLTAWAFAQGQRYLVIATGSGSERSVSFFENVDGAYDLSFDLHSPALGEEDGFGIAIASAANTLLVSAPVSTVAGLAETGRVYQYEFGADDVRLVRALERGEALAGGKFGSFVAADGDGRIFAIGGAAEASEGALEGAVYIFGSDAVGSGGLPAPAPSTSTASPTATSRAPSFAPTFSSATPSDAPPSAPPSEAESPGPTLAPTTSPTIRTSTPSSGPSAEPTRMASPFPSVGPSELPTEEASPSPSTAHSIVPTKPSEAPSGSPTTLSPSPLPSPTPTPDPTSSPTAQTLPPSSPPMEALSPPPTPERSSGPSSAPSVLGTSVPSTLVPSASPTTVPPSLAPSSSPTVSFAPSALPTSSDDGEVEELAAVISNLPELLDACSAIVVDGSRSKGTSLAYFWTLQVVDEEEAGAVIQEQSDAGSQFILSADTALGPNAGRHMTVTLRVVSGRTGKGAVASSTFRVSIESVPLVTIFGGSYQTRTLEAPLVSLAGSASAPVGCDAFGDHKNSTLGTMTYEWRVTSATDDAGQPAVLDWSVASSGIRAARRNVEIPTEYLHLGWTYTMDLVAFFGSASSDSLGSAGAARTLLHISRRGLEVRIAGGTTQQIVAAEATELHCLGNDPDFPDTPVVYAWSCDGGAAELVLTPAVADDRVLVTPAAASVGSTVRCDCRIEAGSNPGPRPGTETATVDLTVFPAVEVPAPKVDLSLRRNGDVPEYVGADAVVNSDDVLRFRGRVDWEGAFLDAPGSAVTVTWNLTDLATSSVTSYSADSFQLFLDAGSLQRGATYVMELTVSPTVVTSAPTTVGFRFRVNQGPSGGAVLLALSDGALMDTAALPLETEIRISLVDAEDPDGIVDYEFWIRGCDSNPDLSSAAASVALSGTSEGASYRLSQVTAANSMATFVPPPGSICADIVAAHPDADVDVLVLSVTATDSRGEASRFSTGLRVLRTTPAPTASPVPGGSSPPTLAEPECQTALSDNQRALRNGEGILSIAWMLALSNQGNAIGMSFVCKRALLELVQEALALDLEAPADLACQTLNLILEGTEVAEILPSDVIVIAVDILASIAQEVEDGIDAEVGYGVFDLLESLLTSVEYLSASRIASSDPRFAASVALIHATIGIEMLRTMVPGQEPLEVDAPAGSVTSTAVSQSAVDADGFTADFGTGSVTLPDSISEALLVAAELCEGFNEEEDVAGLGLLGAGRPSLDASAGGTFTLLLRVCSGTENLLDVLNISSLVLDLALEAGEDARNSTLPIRTPGDASPILNATAECPEASGTPYNVSVNCGDLGSLAVECDGASAGNFSVACPFSLLEGRCRRYDATTDAWSEDGCTFLGMDGGRALCQCDVASAASSRRLQDGDGTSAGFDFAAQFTQIGVEAQYTFTAAAGVTEKDAARASIVLIAVGSLIAVYVVGLVLGYRLDKRERRKRRQNFAGEHEQIASALSRTRVALGSSRLIERQKRVLGNEVFLTIGEKRRGFPSWVPAFLGGRAAVRPRSPSEAALRKTKRTKKLLEEAKDAGTPLEIDDDASVDNNPMHKESHTAEFFEAYDASNASYERQRAENDDASTGTAPGPPSNSLGHVRPRTGTTPLFRLRKKSRPSVRSRHGSTLGLVHGPAGTAPLSTDGGEAAWLADYNELQETLCAVEDEIQAMQLVRTNFASALRVEHEIASLFRYNASDRTVDDVYNARNEAAGQIMPQDLEDSDGALDVESVISGRPRTPSSVSGGGVWSQVQQVWANATRPQKITLLLLELLTIMAVDALFFSGADELIASEAFWVNLGRGTPADLAAQAGTVLLIALVTALFALPPGLMTLAIYSVKREMQAAETIARRILLHAADQLDWEAQLLPRNSAADLAVALLESLAILQLAQNQERDELVPGLLRQTTALEKLRDEALAREMSQAAEAAAASVAGDEESAIRRSPSGERRRRADEACAAVAARHEADVRSGLSVLLTPAERQRVRLDDAAESLLETIVTGQSGSDRSLEGSLRSSGPVSGKASCRGPAPTPAKLYEEWIASYARPSIYTIARAYKCPAKSAAGERDCKSVLCARRKDPTGQLGRRRKKIALGLIFALQAMWGGFCIAYTVLFALTRSNVATAWFFSWIVATVFEVVLVSPIIILATRALAPASAGRKLERHLNEAREKIQGDGSEAKAARMRWRQHFWADSNH